MTQCKYTSTTEKTMTHVCHTEDQFISELFKGNTIVKPQPTYSRDL